MDRILTEAELAEILGKPIKTLAHWRYRRQGPKWFRAGRSPRYRESAVAQWVKEQEELAADRP